MLLKPVTDKVRYAITTCGNIAAECRFQGPLWYHCIGLMNGFYAIIEELKRNVSNNKDPILDPIIRGWMASNATAMSSKLGHARNIATHQGQIVTSDHIEWEIDTWNDTEHPEPYAKVTVKGTSIQNMRGDEFLVVARDAFEFLDKGLDWMDSEYKRQGGTAILR